MQPHEPKRLESRRVLWQVRLRRVKRWAKAALALVIALAAGLYLAACPDEEKKKAHPSGAPSDTATASPEVSGSATPSPSATDTPKVDKKEHRKGMPVRDNLLE